MNKLFTYLSLAWVIPAIGQSTYRTHKLDTLTLKEISFTRPILYKYKTVEFLIEFDTLKNAVQQNIDYYKEILHPAGGNTRLDRKMIRKSIKKLQLVSKNLKLQETYSDTVTISEMVLNDNHYPQNMIKGILTRELDSGRAMVRNDHNNWQNIIIRDKGPWSRLRGGRTYNFPGQNGFFIDIMDWEY